MSRSSNTSRAGEGVVWYTRLVVTMATYGYSCQFVEAIPTELQTECSICLHTVRDPYMVDCCGYRFCKDCIMPVYVAFKKCPLCNGAFSSVIHDIYFLSFERSELEGKYFLIVSVYACIHSVWEIIVCCHSGVRQLCEHVLP